MTGDILRKIREARGLKHTEMARSGRVAIYFFRNTEEIRASYRCGQLRQNARRAEVWGRYIAILRAAKKHQKTTRRRVVLKPLVRQECPVGTTHFLDGEPIRIREHCGKRMGFAWVGEWVRSSRVEDAKRLEVV